MSLESAIEKMIQKAIADGEFENLPGRGKPLDLTAYFRTPEDLRLAYSMLKSSEFIPQEIELMKEIAELKQMLGETVDETERSNITRKLNEKRLTLDLAIERYQRKPG